MPPDLITVERFYDLPSREDVIEELHWGCVVELPCPKIWQIKVRQRMADLLQSCAGPDWDVLQNMPFRAVKQFDLRRVSVGVVARSHVENIGHGDLFGPPEITAKSSASSVPTAKP